MLRERQLLGSTSDNLRSFFRASRAAIGGTSFGQLTNADFAALNVDTSKTINFPVISNDGLAFYFRMVDSSDPGKTGLYETVRTSTSNPFPAAKKMSAVVQAFDMITGISSDRLTLFLQENKSYTVILTRRSLQDPFTNPNEPGPVPTTPGFRTRPLGDCQSLVGTDTTSGCAEQEIVVFTK